MICVIDEPFAVSFISSFGSCTGRTKITNNKIERNPTAYDRKDAFQLIFKSCPEINVMMIPPRDPIAWWKPIICVLSSPS